VCQEAFSALLTVNSRSKELITKHLLGLVARIGQNETTNSLLWAERTRYKQDMDLRNNSLQYLLQRTVAAREAVAAADEAKRKAAGKASKEKPKVTGGSGKQAASNDSKAKKK
jgi:Tfp pilus assembly PilM family ATPase